MVPDIIHQSIKRIARLPGIGQRQASRIVFFLLRTKLGVASPLVKDLEQLLTLQPCLSCSFPCIPNSRALCPICQDPKRDKHTIMIVEKETDLLTIEKSKVFNGTYYVLGGLSNPTHTDSDTQFDLSPLHARLASSPEIKKELIFALSPTAQGNFTANQLERYFKKYNVHFTRLGRGLPNGGDVEFTDEETIAAAFSNRK